MPWRNNHIRAAYTASPLVPTSSHPPIPPAMTSLDLSAAPPPMTKGEAGPTGYRVFKAVRQLDRDDRNVRSCGKPARRFYVSTAPVARFPGTFTVVTGDADAGGSSPEAASWPTLDSIAAWLCGMSQFVRDHLLDDGWLVEDGEYSYPLGQVIEPAGIAMDGMVRRRESA